MPITVTETVGEEPPLVLVTEPPAPPVAVLLLMLLPPMAVTLPVLALDELLAELFAELSILSWMLGVEPPPCPPLGLVLMT